MRVNGTAILLLSLVILSRAGTAWGNSGRSAPGKPARQVTCKGKAVDDTGKPVAGARARLYKLAVDSETLTYDMALAQEVTTKHDGSFAFKTEASEDNMSGQTIILAEKDGLALGWANWELRADHEVEIELGLPQTMAGKVVDDAGKPILDAEVSISFMIVIGKGQPQYLVSAASLEPLTTRTDAEGQFSFGQIPTRATAEFLVKKSPKATVSTFDAQNFRGQALQFSPGQSDIKIVLPPEARIEGAVVEKATGKPAAGIRLLAVRDRNQPNFGSEPIVSGEDGKFTLGALDGGTYTLRMVTPAAEEAEWIAEPVEVVAEAGKTRSGVKVELSKGGLLEVMITEAASKGPVERARVSIRNEAGNEHFSAVSDEGGTARIRLVPGEYQMVMVYKEGYSRRSQQETLTIEDGKTTRLEQQMTSQPRITGVAQDEQGKPLQGAKLQVCPMGTGQTVISDAEGKFEVSWDPGRWHSAEAPAMVLLARHEEGNLAATVKVGEDTQTQDITLRPALTITGRVVDPDGKGIANAHLNFMLRGPRWGSSIGRDQPTTDQDGRFQIGALPAGNKYSLYTSAEGYGLDRGDEIDTDDAINNRLDIGKITLPVADLSVSGMAVDSDDKPVVGANISCAGEHQPRQSARTDADGKFTLNGVCAGEVRISANKSGATQLRGSVETEGGATDVKVVLSAGSSSPTRYVPKQPTSLVRMPLPDLKDVGLDPAPADATGKMLLVLFFDMEQRPSRNYLRQVNTMARKLATQNVVVVAVQASKMDEDSLDNWCKKYSISIPVGMIRSDQEKSHAAWGVRSLPWLILTDRQHIVRSNGFSLNELAEKMKQLDGS